MMAVIIILAGSFGCKQLRAFSAPNASFDLNLARCASLFHCAPSALRFVSHTVG